MAAPTPDPGLMARLARHTSLGSAPTAEHAWLAANGRLQMLEVGEVLTPKGEQATGMHIFLSGAVAIHVDRGVGSHKLFQWRGGDVGGALPFSRGARPPNDAVAEEPTEVLCLPVECLPDLIRECPTVTATLVHAMVDRARQFNAADLRDDKLVSLGRLAAGLAHELNNPASAAVRSAKLLTEHLDASETAAVMVAQPGMSGPHLAAVAELRALCSTRAAGTAGSPLARADREDAIASWLADHDADEACAEALAETGLTLEALDRLAATVQGDALNGTLRWISSACQVRALASEIRIATNRIAELVNSVKGFTFMDRAQSPEPVDVRRGITDTLTMLGAKIRAKGAHVTTRFGDDLPCARAVGAELNQVWMNLIDNALDAVPSSGHVTISGEGDRDLVVVRITDDGPGIPPDIRGRIFDPFFTTKDVGQGTGLGLDAVRRIVGRHEGEVEVDSEPGRTEFKVGASSGDLATVWPRREPGGSFRHRPPIRRGIMPRFDALRPRRRLLAALVAFLLLPALGCRPSAPAATNTFITMADNTYSPSLMRIPVGGHIHFRNWGGQIHNAVAVDGSWSTAAISGQDEVRVGEWVDVAFDRPGVYHFYCKYHGSPDGKMGMVGTIVVGDAAYEPEGRAAGRLAAVAQPTGVVRQVPGEYPNIQTAVDAAAPGDLVLVGEGVYREEVTITTPSVTLRGVDRNRVVLEGEFQRSNGITVFADAVAVENLTAQNYTLNGIFFTGVTGYRGSYVSTYNNGDYGIYAFDSYEGVLDHSLASGSPDAGFYIGGCYPCKTVLDHVTSVMNIGDGYSGTNSGGDLYIVNSVFTDNGGGVAPNTFDVEPHPPQRETTIIGNVVSRNRGSGISIVGGNHNVIERNLIQDNGGYGVLVYATRDRNYYPATGNRVRRNLISGSGRADLALSGLGSLGNCFEGNGYRTSLPWGLEQLQGCGGLRVPVIGDPRTYFGSIAGRNALFRPRDRFGDEWKTWPRPGPEPGLPGGAGAPVRPPVEPFEAYPLDLERVTLPADSGRRLLAARSGTP